MKANKIYRLLVALTFFTCSCSEPDPLSSIGTIMLTSNHDCNINLFDDCDNQIDRYSYEVGKHPPIIQMKSTGVFILSSMSAHNITKTDTLHYNGGNIEFYIEF